MALIVPSLLAFDFARLQEGLEQIRRAGAQTIHVDVCDGHFAPGITVGQPVIRCLRRATSLAIEVHLQVQRPERFVGDFIGAGAGGILIQPESTSRFLQVLREIRAQGCHPGAALGPAMPFAAIRPVFGEIDSLILCGNSHQALAPFHAGEADAFPVAKIRSAPGGRLQLSLASMVQRVREAVRSRSESGSRFTIQIEGAIEPEFVPELEKAGADILVMAAATKAHPDAGSLLRQLTRRSSNPSEEIAIEGDPVGSNEF